MNSKTKLEEVLNLLINNEPEKAQEVFHSLVVEKAREIHQSLIAEDEELEDNLSDDALDEHEMPGVTDHEVGDVQDQIKAEEYFSEDELDGEDEEAPVDGEVEVDGEMDGEMDEPEGEEDVEASDESGEEHEEEELSDKVADLEAEFARLEAEFEALKDEEDEEHGEHEVEEHSHMVEPGHEVDPELDEGSAGVYGETGGGDENFEPNEMGLQKPGFGEPEGIYEEEDFEDLEEGQAMDYLSRAKKTDDKDGKGTGAGGFEPTLKTESPLPQEKVEDRLPGANAKSLMSKQSIHKGFELEDAPGVKAPPVVGQNTFKGNKKLMTHIKKEGDAKAMLNKDHSDGYGAVQTKSPIGSVGTGGNKPLMK